jgi:hypothetical protein
MKKAKAEEIAMKELVDILEKGDANVFLSGHLDHSTRPHVTLANSDLLFLSRP